MEHQDWLITLDMLPISDFVYTKRCANYTEQSSPFWALFDVYKIAPQYPLKISKLGRITNEPWVSNYSVANWPSQYDIVVEPRFYNKSARNDLMGLKIRCGLVVSITMHRITLKGKTTRPYHSITFCIVCIPGAVYIFGRPKSGKYGHFH